MALNREKFQQIKQKIATPSVPEQRHARALVLFNKVLEKLEAEDASSVKGLLFVPGGLQTLDIKDDEAAKILDFLREQGILNTENKIAKVGAETIFNKKKDDFIARMERDPSTAASPVAATADDTASAPAALSSGEPDAALATSLDASKGNTPDSSSTTEGVSFEINAAPQTDFTETPLGKAYAEHSAEFQGEYSFSFLRIQKLITWIIENEHPLDKRELINKINSGSFTKENPENIIERLKQRGIISEDAESGVFLLPASLSPDQLRAKIYFAILDVDDPSVASTVGIFRSFPSVTSAATPAAAPASLDLDISAASTAASSHEPTSPEAGSSEKIIDDLVDHLKTNSWSRPDIYDLLDSDLSFDVALDFVLEVCKNNFATESDDSTQDEKRYRFNYIPDSPDQGAAFKRELTGLLEKWRSKNTTKSSTPEATPDTGTVDVVLSSAPGENPATSLDKKRQRIEGVTRLFSALKSLPQNRSKVAGAIASCFLVLGVGAIMYSGKEKAPEVKPAAEAQADKATGGAVRPGEQQEAVKAPADAYKNAELYKGLDSKKRETVDKLMASTAEQFMMPYLNTVTIYQNGIPKPINLNEASKKTLFKEMNTDWNTLVAKSFSQGPGDPQGADGITLTDTEGNTYNQVYVRVDEQVAKAFKDIRDVTVVVLSVDKKALYPEGKLENIYDTIRAQVANKLK